MKILKRFKKNPKKYIILISIKDESFKDDVALITFEKTFPKQIF